MMEGMVVAGYQVKVELYDDHPLAMAEFISGKYDLLMTGYQLGLGRWQADNSLRLFAMPVWGVSSLMVIDPSLKTLNDLNGKTILVPFKGSPLELQFLFFLKDQNMVDKVALGYAPITQMIPMLLRGQADAIAVPEPLASKLRLQNQARVLFSFAELWDEFTGDPRSPQVGIFVRSSDSVAKANLLEEIRKVLAAQINLLKNVSEETLSKVAPILGVTLELARAALDQTLFDLPGLGDQLRLINHYHNLLGDGFVLTEDFFLP